MWMGIWSPQNILQSIGVGNQDVDLNTREHSNLNRAISISMTSTCRQKHGVVIAHGPKVLAIAVNTDRNSPEICTNPKAEASFHAEINALKQIKDLDYSKLTIYSARTNKHGEPLNAKPCARCQAVIDFLGIGKVIYT